MDIGAMIEGEDRYESLVRQGLGQVTGFEPNSKNLEILNARQGPYRYIPHFLDDGEMATFHLTRYPGCASLLQPNEEIINLLSSIRAEPGSGNFAVTKTIEMETVRLDDTSDFFPSTVLCYTNSSMSPEDHYARLPSTTLFRQ